MSGETWHPGRGFAANHGWRLEQLSYAALSSLYDEMNITRQFSSSELRCHVDVVLLHNDILVAFFVTTGKEQDSPTRNSQYPAWETFDELREIKLSDAIGETSIAMNIVFGNKNYWAKWLLSAKEVLFDSVFYPQYDGEGNFFPIEDQLKQLSDEWKENSPEKPFYKYIQSKVNVKKYPGVEKAYQNLHRFFSHVNEIKESSLKELWESVKNLHETKTYFRKSRQFFDEQIAKYGSPSSRPSVRYAILLNAILRDIEKEILRYLLSSGTHTLNRITDTVSKPIEDVKDAIDFLISLKLVKRARPKNQSSRFRVGKKEIVSSLFIDLSKLGITEELVNNIVNSILEDRKRELVDNFAVVRNWEEYRVKIKDLFSEGLKSKLQSYWNLSDVNKRRIWRKIILDTFGLKESDMRSVISTDRMEVDFYIRDFSEDEMDKLTKTLEERSESLYESSIDRFLSTLKRKIGERVWQELNNPKVHPIDYIIDSIVSDFNPKQDRVTTFFKKLISIRKEQLQTYHTHGDKLLSNQGIVSYPWRIKRGQRTVLLKSRFADRSAVQHRCPEESGRVFGVMFDVGSDEGNIRATLNENNLVFFVPDGYWRDEDLKYLANNGVFIFLNFDDLTEYIENPLVLMES